MLPWPPQKESMNEPGHVETPHESTLKRKAPTPDEERDLGRSLSMTPPQPFAQRARVVGQLVGIHPRDASAESDDSRSSSETDDDDDPVRTVTALHPYHSVLEADAWASGSDVPSSSEEDEDEEQGTLQTLHGSTWCVSADDVNYDGLTVLLDPGAKCGATNCLDTYFWFGWLATERRRRLFEAMGYDEYINAEQLSGDTPLPSGFAKSMDNGEFGPNHAHGHGSWGLLFALLMAALTAEIEDDQNASRCAPRIKALWLDSFTNRQKMGSGIKDKQRWKTKLRHVVRNLCRKGYVTWARSHLMLQTRHATSARRLTLILTLTLIGKGRDAARRPRL